MKRKRSWYHLDHLNSTKMVTDANGEIEVNYIYRAFGEQLKRLDSLGADTDDSAKYSYGGKELDDVTNLYYFNARYYDATIGRFINVDPVQDGTNWYVYTSNNPLNAVDPTGLSEDDDTQWDFRHKSGDYTFYVASEFENLNVVDMKLSTHIGNSSDGNIRVLFGQRKFKGLYVRNFVLSIFMGGGSRAEFDGVYSEAFISDNRDGVLKEIYMLDINWNKYPGMKGLGLMEESRRVTVGFDVTNLSEEERKDLQSSIGLNNFSGVANVIKKEHQQMFRDTLKSFFINIFIPNSLANSVVSSLESKVYIDNKVEDPALSIGVGIIDRDGVKNEE